MTQSASRVKYFNPLSSSTVVGTSQVARINQWVFVAGQRGRDESGHIIALDDDGSRRIRQAFRNLKSILHSQGSSLHDIVRLTIIVASSHYRNVANRVQQESEFFGSGPYPPRMLILASLPDDDIFEVSADAYSHLNTAPLETAPGPMTQRNEKPEKPEKPEKTEKPEKPEKTEKPEKNERSVKVDRPKAEPKSKHDQSVKLESTDQRKPVLTPQVDITRGSKKLQINHHQPPKHTQPEESNESKESDESHQSDEASDHDDSGSEDESQQSDNDDENEKENENENSHDLSDEDEDNGEADECCNCDHNHSHKHNHSTQGHHPRPSNKVVHGQVIRKPKIVVVPKSKSNDKPKHRHH
jgi:enamine deaminase RidA (YjgF/YER057c/UK114 family)